MNLPKAFSLSLIVEFLYLVLTRKTNIFFSATEYFISLIYRKRKKTILPYPYMLKMFKKFKNKKQMNNIE